MPFSCTECDWGNCDIDRLILSLLGVNQLAFEFKSLRYLNMQNCNYEEQKNILKDGVFPDERSQCEEVFSESELFKVKQEMHTEYRPYEFSKCDEAFLNSSQSESPMLEKPYLCSHCGKAFSHDILLKSHEHTHTGGESHQCFECNKTFVYNNQLITHMRTHTGEKPYQCSQCGKAFSIKSNLTSHKKIHTGERSFQCTQCDKTFSSNGYLKIHMRLHTGEKPFKCSQCDKA
ncbi:unnamed protein product, partial [Meganyctiphanes norvegica]